MATALADPVPAHEQRTRSLVSWAWLLFLWTVIYFCSLFTPALLDDADATHAQAARFMVTHHDLVTLHVDGVRYLEKAPLPYWLVAFCYKLFGYNAFSTHLPMALAALLTAWLALRWGTRAYGSRAGFYAALMVLTAVGEFLFTRTFIPEIIISLMLAAALYCFTAALSEKPSTAKHWYAIYVLMALAVLTKGLIGVVFFAGPALLYLLLTGEWRRWREFRLFTGALLFLTLAAPWHILAGLRNQGFFWFYFVNEHFLRFIGKRFPKDYNKLPASLYWSLHLVWLFPWSLFLPLTLRHVWLRLREMRAARSRDLSFTQRTTLLCALQAACVVIFFALSTNQEYYTFPAYFPLLLLTAAALAPEDGRPATSKTVIPNRFSGEGPAVLSPTHKTRSSHDTHPIPRRLTTFAYITFLVLGLAITAALAIGLWNSRHLPYVSDIGTVLTQRNVGDYTLSMSHFFDLTGPSFAALRRPAIIAALVFLIGPVAALLLRLKHHALAATLAIALTTTGFFVAAHLALVRFEPYMSSVVLARAFNRVAQPDDSLLIYGDQSFGSSVIFYAGRQALLVNGESTSLLWGSHYPDVPPMFLDDAGLLHRWNSKSRAFLFVTAEQRDVVLSLLGGMPTYPIAKISGKLLLSNQP